MHRSTPKRLLGYFPVAILALFYSLPAFGTVLTVTNLSDSGAGSLRQAILDANGSAGPDIITFAAALTGTITLTSGRIDITDALNIQGPGAAVLAVSGNNASRIFNIFPGVTASISGLTIKEGRGEVLAGLGIKVIGAIYNLGTLTLTSDLITANSQDGNGAIQNDGTLILNSSTVSGNSAAAGTGGILNLGTLTLNLSTVSGNSTGSAGGGINNNGGTVTLSSSTVSGNTASGVGGGILNGGTLTLNSSTVSGNSSGGSGAGILNNNFGTVTVNSSTVTGNSASGDANGGGIYNTGTMTLNSSVVSDNIANRAGGGIYNTGTLVLTSSAVSDNSAIPSGTGGGIQNNGGTVTLNSSTVSGNMTNGIAGSPNATLFGGGGINNDSGTVNLNYSTISNNAVSFIGGGAGILNLGTMNVNSSTVAGNFFNTAGGSGGGIYNAGNLVLNSSTIAANNAGIGSGAGVFWGPGGSVAVGNTIIAANSALTGPDAYNTLAPAAFTDNGNNLIGNLDGSTGFVNGVMGLISGVDPGLAPLGNYGGPTQTMMLLAGSPAINHGNNSGAPATDQRSLARIVGGTRDMGAVEFQGATLTATAGTPQSGSVGAPFATNLQLTATETGTSNPLIGLSVTFTAPGSGASGTFVGFGLAAPVATNSSGIATAPTLIANGIAGSFSVIGAATTLASVAGVQAGSAITPGFILTTAGPTMSLSLNALTFSGAQGAAIAPQTFAITNAGFGLLAWAASVNYATGNHWLTLSSTSARGDTTYGLGNDTVSVIANSAGLAPGTYSATIIVTSGNANNAPLFVAVTLTVTPGPPPPNPAISENGTVNNASFASGTTPLATGTIAAIFGTNLNDGSSNPSPAIGSDGKVSTSLGGASVTFNGIPAPLFASIPTQLAVQIPMELAGATSSSVVVTVGGRSSNARTVPLGSFSPGIFTLNNQGTGQAAVLIANTSTIAAPAGSVSGADARPANRGEFITIFCTGLGAVSNSPGSGQPTPSTPFSQTTATPQVMIGGIPATVIFSGLAPGYVGLYQVNVQVPPVAPTGSAVPLTMSIGGVPANPVTLALQ